MVHIGNSWDGILADEFNSPYYLQLREFLKREYYHYHIYPNMYDIFNALKYTPYEQVKAVILGQDPYHGVGQAHGLCFSVREGVEPPPSLKNIFTELHSDLGLSIPQSGELTLWAKRGVLLLNTTLTVREGRPMSHKGQGWEQLTDAIISKLNGREQPVVFILWGSHARTKKQLITNHNHCIIESAHPSPLSAYHGFFGSRPFSRTNEFLISRGIAPINWNLLDM